MGLNVMVRPRQAITRQWLDHCDAHEQAMRLLAAAHTKCHQQMDATKYMTPAWRRAANGAGILSRIMGYLMRSSQEVLDALKRAERAA